MGTGARAARTASGEPLYLLTMKYTLLNWVLVLVPLLIVYLIVRVLRRHKF